VHLTTMQRFSFPHGVNERRHCLPCDHGAVAHNVLKRLQGVQHAHKVVLVHSISAVVPAKSVCIAPQ